jgi:tripartite-type tricarboxylate transporter receptor subunit TctC
MPAQFFLRKTLAAASAAAIALAPIYAMADDWPSKPIRLVVGTAAGGGTDIIARDLANFLSKKFNQSVVVENRAGAAGAIGAGYVIRSAPDGYTLLLTQPGTITASVTQNPKPYNPLTDLSSVILLGRAPVVFYVPADSPYKTVEDVIKAAKENPGSLSFSSPGIGTVGHFGAEMFQAAAGVKMRHVPFNGSGPSITSVISRQIPMSFDTLGSTASYLKNGEFRGLLFASNTRSPIAPDIPTAAEKGLQNVESYTWYAVSGPAKLPRPIVDELNAAVQEYLDSSSGIQRMDESGVLQKRGSTPEEQDEFIKNEIERVGNVVKAAGIKIE